MDQIVLWDLTLAQTIKLFIPLIIAYYALMIFAIIKLSKDKVKYLPKWAWVLIILFVNMFGPIIYLMIGRERD